MKFVYVFLLAGLALVGAEDTSCFKNCPSTFEGYCGFDGVYSYKLFRNKCLMEEQRCRDGKSWTEGPLFMCVPRPRSASCLKACPAIYAPVCGFDGVNYKVFSNKCMMEVESCTDSRPWTLVATEQCKIRSLESCPTACPMIYLPTCGFNGEEYKVFGNPCFMEQAGCKKSKPYSYATMDRCNTPAKRSCENKACPAIYAPVCGFNGKSYKVFDNKCFMEAQTCTDAQHWTLTNISKCGTLRSSNVKDCMRACPDNYAPVCGFDGQKYAIFGNKCSYEASNCMDSYKWNLLSLGDCEKHGVYAY